MFAYDFMVNAFIAAGVVALVSALVGYFLVLRGQSFAGHALSHVGFTGATGGQTDIHEVSNVVVSGDAPPSGPLPATLSISSVIKAPSGSSQAATQLTYSGTCPSSFTTAAIGNGGSLSPTLTGAVAGTSCTVAEATPSESGWTTTASVNGGAPIALTASGGKLTVPAFALSGGTNTVQFTNTYASAPPVATLKISNTINAPSGSSQAATQLTYSGSCPSSFTTAALASGASATPTLTSAVAGSNCAVSEAAPSGSGWSTTACGTDAGRCSGPLTTKGPWWPRTPTRLRAPSEVGP